MAFDKNAVFLVTLQLDDDQAGLKIVAARRIAASAANAASGAGALNARCFGERKRK